MSRSLKRSMAAAYDRESGRVPVIRKLPDSEVSHSKDCYMCISGRRPKRILLSKPRRSREKLEARKIIAEELAA